jgi:hypothetical protein
LIGDLSVSKKLFPTRTFSVEDIKNLESYGFELLDIAGKVVFGPYVEKKLARYLEKVLEIEHRYCRVKELIGRSEHIHFVLKKVQ